MAEKHALATASLATTLTTVFAWVPVLVLTVLAWIGVATSFSYFAEIPWYLPVMSLLVALLASFCAWTLTTVCWRVRWSRLQLSLQWQCLGLLLGFITLAVVVVVGWRSQHEFLHLRLGWVEAYFFIMPLCLLLWQCIVHWRQLQRSKLSLLDTTSSEDE